ncbi:dihydrofolate reductase-like domain-containing protein [Pilobolus umbonatus]|nr:dihydrofolate reductase-like domain-containing protein [Pilobolus umbonatus]
MEGMFQLAKDFLHSIYSCMPVYNDRPFITLTYAQSIDGKISIQGRQLMISGTESMAMTHRLRTIHDGIMVGIGTALIDNPQLNARYVPVDIIAQQPQPIIIDPFLRYPLTGKLITNYKSNAGRQLWLIASEEGVRENSKKKAQLEHHGVKIFTLPSMNGHIPLETIFRLLRKQGIQSLMIEGGSKIIQSSLSYCDQLIVTIAPLFIGEQGVPSFVGHQQLKLNNVKYQVMGKDMVMSATLCNRQDASV